MPWSAEREPLRELFSEAYETIRNLAITVLVDAREPHAVHLQLAKVGCDLQCVCSTIKESAKAGDVGVVFILARRLVIHADGIPLVEEDLSHRPFELIPFVLSGPDLLLQDAAWTTLSPDSSAPCRQQTCRQREVKISDQQPFHAVRLIAQECPVWANDR